MEDLAVRLDRATCNRQTFVYHTDSLLWYTQGEVWRIWPFVWIGLPAIDKHLYTILTSTVHTGGGMEDLAVRLDRATCNRQTFVYHTDFYGTHRGRYGGFGRSSG